jgi:hypothetical protein
MRVKRGFFLYLAVGLAVAMMPPGRVSPSPVALPMESKPATRETKYHEAQEIFLGELARAGRTAFRPAEAQTAILDSPQVWGCDNPSIFEADGVMYFIFGDPEVHSPGGRTEHPSGAMAFTSKIVPEKGLDLAHRRHWITDPQRLTAKSLIARPPGVLRANCIGGAVLPHGNGKRVWFAYYDYGGPGEEPSFLRYLRLGLAYSDDWFQTPAVRDEKLVFWEKQDPRTGPVDPNPFLGYPMRVFKDHLYLMIPRKGTPPALLRCRLDELDKCSPENWRYLVSVTEQGRATWSSRGLRKGQISQQDFPTVDFGPFDPGIVNTVIWNPHMNRWIALNIWCGIWEARHFWGPYRHLESPRPFPVSLFWGGYDCFSHELLLGDNGEWIYYARARAWQETQKYGAYLQKLRMRERLKLTLSRKCALAGDTLAIECLNDSGLPSPPPRAVSVTVDGRKATFQSQRGDSYFFTYKLTGDENAGKPGAVEVAAAMEVPHLGAAWRVSRDVALIVNHINNLTCVITSPRRGQTVSGLAFIEARAGYQRGPEDLGPGRPEVRLLKVELRRAEDGKEVVEDADACPPYKLRLDTTRCPNGLHTFKVIAYDTLDRRGLAAVTLRVRNPAQRRPRGNLVADGNMEAGDPRAWQPFGGCALRKISGEDHRTGLRSLLLSSDLPRAEAGAKQAIAGLSGGERLRFSAWSRLLANYTGELTWSLLDAGGKVVLNQACNSYGYFRGLTAEFENPPGNERLTLVCAIKDPGSESTVAGKPVSSVQAVIDDVVLRPVRYPLVEPPGAVRSRRGATITWEPSRDVNVEYYYIYREGRKLAEVESHSRRFVDEALPDPQVAPAYRVTAVDAMGRESPPAEPSPSRVITALRPAPGERAPRSPTARTGSGREADPRPTPRRGRPR